MSQTVRRGLYEQILTEALESRLGNLDPGLTPERKQLHRAEAANRIALHLAGIIERAVSALKEDERVSRGIELARELIHILDARVAKAQVAEDTPIPSAEILQAILERQPDGEPRPIGSPLIPLLDTTLLTNAPGEPRVGHQILAEIESADRIDVLMAFIRNTGVVPLREALRRHCASGRPLRILTTTYTGSTERKALDLLQELGGEIRVSYDTSSTRLHAKAWLFHRDSGFSTAYIGSSNLTHSAQVSGLEWNVRVSGARNRDVIDKVAAVFDSYWEHTDFRSYTAEDFDRETKSRGDDGPRIYLSPVELRPEPFQSRLLEQIAISRRRGHHRNLLVSATGTGKTVMAALDYAALRKDLRRARLLFVAHRQEILDQSQATFRHALRDTGFGEPWRGGKRPRDFEHVFASIQSLNLTDLDHLAPDHFDVVIVDEFHHAAAASYERLLEHMRPAELLGLTATPERADGLPVLHWFGDRIAAELRLWDAIDQHYLTPFMYFGIHDGLDLSEIPWRRGKYDVDGLTNLYTAHDSWVRFVIQEVVDRAENLATMRALGFCVSVDHARYTARMFREAGIPSVAVWGGSPAAEREAALRDLAGARLKVVFSVDLFNEGVDLPAVDTLLLLRPTESPTLFLQQLGRGLRKAQDKTVCTVLDFVGHHRKEFRFDRRFRALLGGTRKDVEKQIAAGFPYLPAGCHMELDRKSSEIVLRNIRDAIPSKWPQRVEELRALVDSGRSASLAEYIEHTGLELEDVYSGNRGWSDLIEAAGLEVAAPGPEEKTLRRAIGRMLHVDDELRLAKYAELLSRERAPSVARMQEATRRLTRMLVASLVDKAVDKTVDLQRGIDLLWEHPQVRAEVRELLSVLQGRVDHLHRPLKGRPEVPLSVHARYTRLEILAAFGVGDRAKVAPWQTGVYWAKDAKADLLAFTLEKTEEGFSPTTRYRDYAISREQIHWETQSVTREESPTGRRYRHHEALGTDVMLFARLRQSDRAFWFLGPGRYVRHSGERPMGIVWQLAWALPGDLYAAFGAAVA